MENWVGLIAKTPIPATQKISFKKRGFGGRVFRGGKGRASGAGALGRSPIEYVFELTEVYKAIENRERDKDVSNRQ